MDDKETAKYWESNAADWARLSRAGYDTYRDQLNTPAFFRLLPEVQGMHGLDIGCGEGYNTRLLVSRGCQVTAIDIAPTFVHLAAQAGQLPGSPPLSYSIASALELPFPSACFDFATAFVSLMDIPDTARVLAEASRVIRPGGFLQFSITHPCFDTPHRVKLKDEKGRHYATEVGGYFHNLQGEIDEWIFSAAPPSETAGMPPFRIPRFTHTISQWLNLLISNGLVIEQLDEPCPDDGTVSSFPNLQDAQVVAYFLIVRARKPLAGFVPG